MVGPSNVANATEHYAAVGALVSTIIRSNDFVKIDIDTASHVYFLKEKSY